MSRVHRELNNLREQQRAVIARGFESGELEPCNMTGEDSGGYCCHRGGIGCTLEHEGDPPELHTIQRRTGRRSTWDRVFG
jgi:hypothetical protein